MTVLSPGSIARVAYGAGFRGEALVTSVAVALAESSGRDDVVNSIGCVGLWQINQPVHVRAHPTWTREWCQNAVNNASAAFILSGGGATWGPWEVYTTGAYKKFIATARSAAGGAASAAAPVPVPPSKGGGTKAPVRAPRVVDDAKKKAASPSGVAAKPEPEPPAPRAETNEAPRVRLGNVFLHGGQLQADIAEAVTGADLSWSTTAVTQLELTIADPGFVLYRTGLFTRNVAVLYRDVPTGARGDDDGVSLNLRVAAVTLDGGAAGTGGMTVACRAEVPWKLKARRGALVMKKASPSDFVTAECKAVGAKAVVQPSPKRGQVARDVSKKGKGDDKGAEKPSSWTTFTRLANELGYLMFEFEDTVYFGKPSWLVARIAKPLDVALPLEGAPDVWTPRTMPTIVSSEDSDVPLEVSDLLLERSRFSEFDPGAGMVLRGLPPFNTRLIINSMNMSLLGTGPMVLTASTPIDPPKQPPVKAKKAAAASSRPGGYDPTPNAAPSSSAGAAPAPVAQTGGKSALAFVNMAISASNARYVFGAEASTSTALPAALDCSELVQWALGRIGIPFVDGSSAQYAASRKISIEQAFNTRGALLWKSGHIGISMGNGSGTVEARNPTAGVGIFNGREIAWQGGGLVPGLAYG